MPILASRLPQPARLRQSKTKGPTPSQSPVAGPQVIPTHGQSQARRSFLSPKSHWSPTLGSGVTSPKPVAKYQLQDPGAVPGSPKVYKRTFNPPAPSTKAPLGRSSHTKKTKLPSQDVARNDGKPSNKPEARGVPIPTGLPQARPYLPPLMPAMMGLGDPVDSPMSDVSIAATVATAIPTLRPRGGGIPIPSPRNQMPIPTIRHSAGHRHMRDPDQQSSLSSLPTRNASSSTSSCSKSNRIGGRTDTTLACSSTSTSDADSSARTSTGTTTTSPSPASSPVGSDSDASPDMTLVWQPDPESLESEVDPAENLWKEIETRLGGRRMTGKAKRGQWVLTPRIPCPITKVTLPSASVLESQPQSKVSGLEGSHDDKGYRDGDIRGRDTVADGPGLGVGMERAESEFTVSAYFDPDLTTPRVPSQSFPHARMVAREGTALFDMSAPLIYSRSNESATPANTPQIRAETIRRAPRVGGHTTTGGKGSLSSLALTSDSDVPDHSERYRSRSSSQKQSHADSTAAYLPNGLDTVMEDGVGVGIYRLDSHVVAALQALGGASPGAGLDMALESSSSSTGPSTRSYASITTASTHSGSSEFSRAGTETDTSSGMGSGGLGLGVGMHIRLDSIYSLITNTSPRWRTRAHDCEVRSSGSNIDTSRERGREREMAQRHEPKWGQGREQVEKGKERMGSLIVTDLDTGHKLDLSLSRLDEMIYL